MNNYHLYEEIGHGKHSTVYKGRQRGSIQYFAIKSVDKSKRSRVLNEVSLSALFGSDAPHIAQLYHWHETRNHLWVVAEYCAGGDLGRTLKQDEKIIPEAQVRNLASQITSGLLAMHAKGIVYADLKPSNVLFTESGDIKLSGFSVSQRIADLEIALSENRQVPRRGSPFYMAPELFSEDGCHTFASDIWALGAVIFEMVTGSTPFGFCRSFQDLQKSVLATSSPAPDLTQGSEELRHLVARMLAKNPAERIRWKELVSHPWWSQSASSWETLVESFITPLEDRIFSHILKQRFPAIGTSVFHISNCACCFRNMHKMSTAIFTRTGKNQFAKLRVYRDFGGANVKNDSASFEQRPIHQAVQAAVTHVDFLQTDNLSGIPLNDKINNRTRGSDPYLAQHLRGISKIYFKH